MIIKIEHPDVGSVEVRTGSPDAHSGLVDNPARQDTVNDLIRVILKVLKEAKEHHESNRRA